MKEVEVKRIELFGRPYFVSADGCIYIRPGKEMTRYADTYGYEYISIRRNGRRKKYLTHRLVADAFIPNPKRLPQVNHIDGNKKNNNVSNLEWVNNSDNQMHSRYVLGNKTGFDDVPVECVESGETFISTRDAWRKTGVSYSHISECASGKRKTAGGFHWRRCLDAALR